MAAADDLGLLRLDVAASYVRRADGRIEAARPAPAGPRRDSPAAADASPAARAHLAGCAAGNLVHVAADLSEATAAEVLAAAGAEPPWRDPDAPPHALKAIAALLTREAPVQIVGPEILFRLPNRLAVDAGAAIVRCDTAAGEALLARLAEAGMPKALTDAGFLGLADFWWPWCVAMAGPQIAAMAFATRLAPASAEIGVYTFAPHRGRGLGAAVTAAWSSLESLEGRALIYGTRLTNVSSRRVAARLGLAPFGARVRFQQA